MTKQRIKSPRRNQRIAEASIAACTINSIRSAIKHHNQLLYLDDFSLRSLFLSPRVAVVGIPTSKAIEYVRSGMVLSLGTGSTAAFVVAKIGHLLKTDELKDIVGIPTEEQALSLGIPLSILDDHPKLDLAIDGADEVDPDLNLGFFE